MWSWPLPSSDRPESTWSLLTPISHTCLFLARFIQALSEFIQRDYPVRIRVELHKAKKRRASRSAGEQHTAKMRISHAKHQQPTSAPT